MRILATISLVALTTAPSLAALPPHYQRQNELMAILNEAVEVFGIMNPIESIVMQGPDIYEVSSEKCTMQVQIVDVPVASDKPPMVGPRNFAVEAGPLVCSE